MYDPYAYIGGAHAEAKDDTAWVITDTGTAVMATLRSTAVGCHRINGATNIARANRRSHDLIEGVNSS